MPANGNAPKATPELTPHSVAVAGPAPLSRSLPTWALALASLPFAAIAAAAAVLRRQSHSPLALLSPAELNYRGANGTAEIAMAAAFGLRPPPFINPLTLTSLGLVGQWEEVSGNFISLPPPTQRIKGVVYFLGGFFFGRVPHVLYRNMLDEIVRNGYVVVATPYQLQGFDYTELTESVVLRVNSSEGWIRRKLNDVGLDMASLPAFAVGHSCGALLTLMIEAFHPQLAEQRTGGSAFISFNNKRVTDAIPALDTVVSPLAKALYNESGPSLNGMATVGEAIGQQFLQLRSALRGAVEATTSLPIVPPIVKNELLPLEEQLAPLTNQVGPLLEAVAKDELNFNPSSDMIRQKAVEAYDAPRTLVVQFETDTLDETPVLQGILNSIDRAKGKVQYEQLPGNHFTPLTQDPLPLDREIPPDAKAVAQALNALSGGFDQQVRTAALADYRGLARVLLQWLDEGAQSFAARTGHSPTESNETPEDFDPEKYDDLEPSA